MGWRVPLHASQAAMPGCIWFPPYVWATQQSLFGFSANGVCPTQLAIWLDRPQVRASSTPSFERVDIAGVFNGGTLTGSYKFGSISGANCGSDPYLFSVAVSSSTQGGYLALLVDVWAARRANAWSSSVTIDVYAATEPAMTVDLCVSIALVQPIPYTILPFDSTGTYLVKKSVTTQLAALACPSVKKATVTVNEDGTVSIV